MKYAIGIDLGGTSIKYALVDKAGNSFFEGKLPSFASVSAAKVMEQLIKAATLLKDEAAKQNWTVLGIGLGTPGIVDETNRIVLGGAENIVGWENCSQQQLFKYITVVFVCQQLFYFSFELFEVRCRRFQRRVI